MAQLTAQEQKELANKIFAIRASAATLGNVGGLYLAYKKSSGFWGYIGYMLLGGVVFGSLAYVATMPLAKKLADSLGTPDAKVENAADGKKKLITESEAKAIVDKIRKVPMDYQNNIPMPNIKEISPMLNQLTDGGWKLDLKTGVLTKA
jgi:hypothetical protein